MSHFLPAIKTKLALRLEYYSLIFTAGDTRYIVLKPTVNYTRFGHILAFFNDLTARGSAGWCWQVIAPPRKLL
jgi:hypothetical protein